MAIENILLSVFIFAVFLMSIVGIIIYKRTKFFTGNEALLIAFDTRFTNGRAIGIIIREESVAHGRVKIHYSPIDVCEDDFVRNEIQTVIVEKDSIINCHKGSWSKGRNVVIVLPDSLDDISENLNYVKFTPFFNLIKDIGDERVRYKALKEQNDRIVEFSKEIGNGEWSEQLLHRFKDIAVNAIKLRDELDKKKLPAGGQYQHPL